MHAKCAECGGKIDCDDIICANCLAEIINKLYFNNQGISKKGRAKERSGERSIDFKQIKHSPA
jgi:predicted nucleic acid-binding Zn ribbon protein